MDHETAVRTGATERYLLGQLSAEDRDSFEEHYFMCPECAEDVQTLTVFAANAKAVFREKASGPAPYTTPYTGMFRSGQVLWLSAALNAVLLLGAGYLFFQVNPARKRELAEARAPQFVQEVTVLGTSRGPTALREISSATQRIVFSFYLSQPFRNIRYELKDESGAVRAGQILPSPPKEDSDDSHLALSTAGLQPGAYNIRIWGVAESGEIEIGASNFKIEGTPAH